MINHDAIQAVLERAVAVMLASQAAAGRQMARRQVALGAILIRQQGATVRQRISHLAAGDRRRLVAMRRRQPAARAMRRRQPAARAMRRRQLHEVQRRRRALAALLPRHHHQLVVAVMPVVAGRSSPVAARNPKSASASVITPFAVRKPRRRLAQWCARAVRLRYRQ